MTKYKLYYFNVRARTEVIRTLFAQAGVEYEDIRFDSLASEDWQQLKASGKTPFGQLPILEVDGVVIAQSMAIMRFVAEEVGLSPSTALDRARADMIVDADMDIIQKLAQWHFEKDEEKKKTLHEELFGKYLPQNLEYLEKLLKSNDKGFFVGDKLTYADIHFFTFINGILAKGKIETPPELEEMLKGFPSLYDLYNRVLNQPNILKWLKTRPDSDM